MQWANHDLAMCRQAFDHGDKSPATSNVSYECPRHCLVQDHVYESNIGMSWEYRGMKDHRSGVIRPTKA